MKRFIFIQFLAFFSVVIFLPEHTFACKDKFTETSNNSSKPRYFWHKAASAGKGCFPENCADGQFPMAIVPVAGFEDKLWSVGSKTIWFSADGIGWKSEPKTDWGERHGMAFVYFDKKLWMLGGMKSWDDFRNDIWSSTDGKNWKQVEEKAVWSPRRGHGVVVFKNKLWLLGGAKSSGRRDQTPTDFLNDVWSSDDGIKWEQITANAPWNAKDGFVTLVFKEKIWVIGGKADVWSSEDGKTWTQISEKAAWGERGGYGGLVFDEKIWIFGGVELNDVWFSADGKNWQTAFANAPWSTRSAAYSVVFKNKLWIYSGKTGRADSWEGDIWAMGKKTE